MSDDLRARAAAAAMAVWSQQPVVMCEHTQMIPIGAIVDACLAVRDEEMGQLRYERRLLGAARLVLDLVAAGDSSRWEQARREAEDLAQRIVDEIGHPVTDEPALGPGYRAEISRLRAGESEQPAPDGTLPTPAEWIRMWNDTPPERRLAWATRVLALQAESSRCFMLDHDGRLDAAEAELRRLRDEYTVLNRIRDAMIIWDKEGDPERPGAVSEEQAGDADA